MKTLETRGLAMPENVLSESVGIHLFFSYFLFIPPLLNLYYLAQESRFITLAKRLKFVAPAYYFLMAAVAFSGVVLGAMLQHLSAINLLMFAALLGIFIGEVKRHKRQKGIASHEVQAQEDFKAWAKRKYALDLLLLSVAFVAGMRLF